MHPNDSLQSAAAASMLFMLPPSLRKEIIASGDFCKRYDVGIRSTISFSKGPSFDHQELFAAIRSAYEAPGTQCSLKTTEGAEVKLSVDNADGSRKLLLTQDDSISVIPSFWYLSPDTDDRLSNFNTQSLRCVLSDASISRWRAKLEQSPLNDQEALELRGEMRLAPLDMQKLISIEVQEETSRLSVLVPSERPYYTRLIGDFESVLSFDHYVNEVLPAHIAKLSRLPSLEALRQILLFSASRRTLTNTAIGSATPAVLEQLANWASSNGDLFSQVGAIEILLPFVGDHPWLEERLITIGRSLLELDPEEHHGRLALTSQLIMFVDGELSRLSIFSEKPPSVRRMAAIAQASIIERALLPLGVVGMNFEEWFPRDRAHHFLIQTLIDLRLEPRWYSEMILPPLLKHELVSRLYVAANNCKDAIPEGNVRRFFADEDGEVCKALNFPYSFQPGPLEGATTPLNEPPPAMLNELLQLSAADRLKARSFAPIVNCALVYRFAPEHTRAIVDALRKFKYQIDLEEDDLGIPLLMGLAVLAASSRSADLAYEVRVLTRVLRNRIELDASAQVRIGLTAAAAHEGLDQWSEYVGSVFEEVARSDVTRDEAIVVRFKLQKLCSTVQSAWKNCGRASALLECAMNLPGASHEP